ncbi:hypothetical protein [Clostridium estertheticum]|uniref:hypothetical protein n=1 Tax=Clostridium estertheticum TaxID=238834 RepID=UPI001CF4655B|nr:hypothetical protein [Clostridium estertheticum]MCB2354715.1 hypothetical protein [Clostridium estertheticum]WAG40957.1 hypothetical protein LL065_22385 [Clostridium estertheticum]
MNSNTFVCLLSQEKQDKIKELVTLYAIKEGYGADEIEKMIVSVMENRLWNIEDIIDIKQFLI